MPGIMLTAQDGRVAKREIVCPESTIESANARNTKFADCPNGKDAQFSKALIDSLPRRNFIRKAALITASAAVASSVVGNTIIPQSDASSRGSTGTPTSGCSFVACNAVVVDKAAMNNGTIPSLSVQCNLCPCNPSYYCVWPLSCSHVLSFGPVCGSHCSISGAAIGSQRVVPGSCTSPNQDGLDFYTNYTKRLSVTASGKVGIGTTTPSSTLQVVGAIKACSLDTTGSATVGGTATITDLSVTGTVCVTGRINGQFGVVGTSASGQGVKGSSCSGIGLEGLATGSTAIPIVARAASSQSAPIQEWQNNSGSPLAVVSSSGALGIGTAAPAAPLDVLGASPTIGKFQSSSVADRSALIQFVNNDTTAVEWNLGVAGKCNASKVQDGSFYFQKSGLSGVPVAINKCGYVGINNNNPYRRLCVTGRIQASCGVGVGTQTINTTLAVNGSIAAKARALSTPQTLSTTDFAILASGTISLELPPAATQIGMMIFVKNVSSGTVSVAPGGKDKLENSISAKSVAAIGSANSGLMFISDGSSNWYVLSSASE